MTVQFYTGSYAHKDEAGITCVEADFEQGTLTTVMCDTQAECPSWLKLHPNGKILYAVRELTEEGGLYTFAVEGETLRLISELPTQGKDPCYISMGDSERFLFVINYSGSSFAVFRLDADGIPQEMTQHIVHSGNGPNPARQEAAHPHCAVYQNGILYVCDLGMDRIFRYRLDEEMGTLQEEWGIPMPAGSGPRHLCISPKDSRLLYVVGELSNKVYVVRWHETCSEILQEVSTLPDGFMGVSTAAAIKYSDDGGALFVSNRGDDSIAVFRVLPDGLLEKTGVCPTGGKTPRDFAVFGEYLVAANQDSDSLTVLHFDRTKNTLKKTEMICPLIRPTFIAKK